MSTQVGRVSPPDLSESAAETRSVTGVVMVVGFAIWAAIVIYYIHIGFSVYREDLQHYIDWSYNLRQHSDYASHMPGWPALIWFARTVTFGMVEDTILAQVLCFIAWAVGVLLCVRILARLSPELLRSGLIGFAFFPLIGVSTAANPFCDVIAYAFALGALLFAMKRNWAALAGVVGIGLLIHQAFYGFYFALVVACVLVCGMPLLYAAASGAPFVVYYLRVALQKNDLNWIAHFHEKVHGPEPGRLPVLQGIIGTALRFTPKDEVKAVLLGLAFIAAVTLSVYCIRSRNWLLLSACVPTVLAGILSPENVAFVILRLAKFLVFPACCWIATRPRVLRLASNTALLVVAIILLVISQFVWARYSVIFYGYE